MVENKIESQNDGETVEKKAASPLTLSKSTVRVMRVQSDLRAGEIAACSSCPSRISHVSNTVMV